jgi:hypothetical protein
VYSCTNWLRPRTPPAFGLIDEGGIGQRRWVLGVSYPHPQPFLQLIRVQMFNDDISVSSLLMDHISFLTPPLPSTALSLFCVTKLYELNQ